MSTFTTEHEAVCLAVYDLLEHGKGQQAAQLIADSEARAVAAKVSSLTCTHHNDAKRAACPVCLVAALTAERDQLLTVLVHADQILDDIDTCSDAHKPMYSSYSQNVFKLCIKGRDARRAAIDAAMKEETK